MPMMRSLRDLLTHHQRSSSVPDRSSPSTATSSSSTQDASTSNRNGKKGKKLTERSQSISTDQQRQQQQQQQQLSQQQALHQQLILHHLHQNQLQRQQQQQQQLQQQQLQQSVTGGRPRGVQFDLLSSSISRDNGNRDPASRATATKGILTTSRSMDGHDLHRFSLTTPVTIAIGNNTLTATVSNQRNLNTGTLPVRWSKSALKAASIDVASGDTSVSDNRDRYFDLVQGVTRKDNGDGRSMTLTRQTSLPLNQMSSMSHGILASLGKQQQPQYSTVNKVKPNTEEDKVATAIYGTTAGGKLQLRSISLTNHPALRRQESMSGPYPLDKLQGRQGHIERNHLSSRRSGEEDPGIMSEVETSATGSMNFKRSTRSRSSLPIVRTPSKTQDRSLGLVFLQYRSETKRALLPNEITSLDTVKALFVRSFPRQLTMQYLDSRNVRMYIHDSVNDMFYELENLNEIKDRTVLRIYEQDLENGTWQAVDGNRPPDHPRMLNHQVNQELLAAANAVTSQKSNSNSNAKSNQGQQQQQPRLHYVAPAHLTSSNANSNLNANAEDPSYFSEPEFESDFQNHHIHRAQRNTNSKERALQQQQQPQQQGTNCTGLVNNSCNNSQYYGTIIIPAYRTAAMMHQHVQQAQAAAAVAAVSNAPPPRPPERSTKLSNVFPGYSQTMPRNMSLATYGNIGVNSSINQPSPTQQQQQRSVSPDLVSKRQLKDTSAPPKPQRSFPILVAGNNSGQIGNNNASILRANAGQQQQTPMSPNHVTFGVPAGATASAIRPLPDRPYSVAGQFPGGPMLTGPHNAQFAGPDRRSFPSDFTAIQAGYISSPERRINQPSNANVPGELVRSPLYGANWYGQPVIEDVYASYGHGIMSSRPSSVAGGMVDDLARIKMENMERQLANLTGMVQAALNQPGQTRNHLEQSGQGEKSKPPPPPKPLALYSTPGFHVSRQVISNPAHMTSLKNLQRQTKSLKEECCNLKKFVQSQAQMTSETLNSASKSLEMSLNYLNGSSCTSFEKSLRLEKLKLSNQQQSYRDDVCNLEKDLNNLEASVEELRSNVINRRCKVSMSDVENMAQILTRASDTIGELRVKYPKIQNLLKSVMKAEMQIVAKEEKFLKEEPERLEIALRKCKKLTGTLVTLKRLASVQEQRSSASTSSPTSGVTTSNSTHHSSNVIEKSASVAVDSSDKHARASRAYNWRQSSFFREKFDHPTGFNSTQSLEIKTDGPVHTVIQVTPATPTLKNDPRGESALESLLDELQTFSKPNSSTSSSSSNKKPIPPPRSSSRINEQASQLMLLSSLTAAALVSARNAAAGASVMRSNSIPASTADLSITYRPKSTPPVNTLPGLEDSFDEETADAAQFDAVTSPMSDVAAGGSKSRQQILEDRHQELLRKQRLLQEQYTKLQMLSRGHIPKGLLNDLKKTGSESNIMSKSLPPSLFNDTLSDDKCPLDLINQTGIGSGAHTISGGNINTFLPHLKQQIMQQRTAQALLEQQLQQSADALKMSGSNMVPLINGGKAQTVDRSVLAAAAAAAVMSNSNNGNDCSPSSSFVTQVANNFVNCDSNSAHDETMSNMKVNFNTPVNNSKSTSNATAEVAPKNTFSSNNTGSPRRSGNNSAGKVSSINAPGQQNKFETQVYETDII